MFNLDNFSLYFTLIRAQCWVETRYLFYVSVFYVDSTLIAIVKSSCGCHGYSYNVFSYYHLLNEIYYLIKYYSRRLLHNNADRNRKLLNVQIFAMYYWMNKLHGVYDDKNKINFKAVIQYKYYATGSLMTHWTPIRSEHRNIGTCSVVSRRNETQI